MSEGQAGAVRAASGGEAAREVARAMAAFDAALSALAALDVESLPVAAAAPLVEALVTVQRRVDSEVLRAVGRFDASGAWQLDGASSAAAWLRAGVRLTPSDARASVRAARRLRELPVLAAAFAEGEISRGHVAVVTDAMARTPARRATIAAAEPTFAQAARTLDPAQLARVVRRWACTVDPLGAIEQEAAAHEQRHLSVSSTFEGAVALSGVLAPEPGALVLAALEALSTQEYRAARGVEGTESRTPGQRRADALVALARRYLDSGEAPEVAGVRPHLTLTVPLPTLAARRSAAGCAPGELDGVGPVSGEAARRIACDALLTAMQVDPSGMPLSYGRTVRVVPAPLRRVVVARDRGCRFPGCDRPAAWCQVHHLVHWAHGGRTDASNLVLLCDHHHHRMHEGGFVARGSPGTRLTFHRADGTRIEDRSRAP